jgi:hypothetical protein
VEKSNFEKVMIMVKFFIIAVVFVIVLNMVGALAWKKITQVDFNLKYKNEVESLLKEKIKDECFR